MSNVPLSFKGSKANSYTQEIFSLEKLPSPLFLESPGDPCWELSKNFVLDSTSHM